MAIMNVSDQQKVQLELTNDFGTEIPVSGYLTGEEMYFDDQTGMLTLEKLYSCDDGAVAYSIISAIGHTRERRAYRIEEHGETCLVEYGVHPLELPIEPLLELLAQALEADQETREGTLTSQVRTLLAVNE